MKMSTSWFTSSAKMATYQNGSTAKSGPFRGYRGLRLQLTVLEVSGSFTLTLEAALFIAISSPPTFFLIPISKQSCRISGFPRL
ncbi:unnamed protein product [Linum tenue]|uniref:Uncharacterized protein n=1 Tax=Linum tenue TaxID=586396 RepID=A0AAV0HPG8_9ROSI|nr:unnamed protein product [Linum tenue]